MFQCKLFSRNILHRVYYATAMLRFTQCGKTRNSLPRNFFPSNQFIAKFFSKTLISRNFYEKTVAVKFRNFISVMGTVWKKEKFSLTKFFREIISLVSTLAKIKTLVSRIFCQKCVKVNSSDFHTVCASE